jgi:Ni,Fe-hydrogenase I large subunit
LTGAGIAAQAIVRGIKDEALDWQRDVIRMQALLGAKNLHPQTFLVGGMSIPKEVTDGVLKKLQVGPEALFSTLGRTAARGIETLVTAEMLPVWIYELAAAGNPSDHLFLRSTHGLCHSCGVHAGFAIHRIDREAAEEALKLIREITECDE